METLFPRARVKQIKHVTPSGARGSVSAVAAEKGRKKQKMRYLFFPESVSKYRKSLPRELIGDAELACYCSTNRSIYSPTINLRVLRVYNHTAAAAAAEVWIIYMKTHFFHTRRCVAVCAHANVKWRHRVSDWQKKAFKSYNQETETRKTRAQALQHPGAEMTAMGAH